MPGLASRALTAIGKWLGNIPGRLAVISIIAGTIFAAASGSSMASAATLGSMLIPEMHKQKYDVGLSVGSLAAAGALAILLTEVLVIYGGLSQIPVGELGGGIGPGLLLSALLVIYIVGLCILKPSVAPAYRMQRTT